MLLTGGLGTTELTAVAAEAKVTFVARVEGLTFVCATPLAATVAKFIPTSAGSIRASFGGSNGADNLLNAVNAAV